MCGGDAAKFWRGVDRDGLVSPFEARQIGGIVRKQADVRCGPVDPVGVEIVGQHPLLGRAIAIFAVDPGKEFVVPPGERRRAGVPPSRSSRAFRPAAPVRSARAPACRGRFRRAGPRMSRPAAAPSHAAWSVPASTDALPFSSVGGISAGLHRRPQKAAAAE